MAHLQSAIEHEGPLDHYAVAPDLSVFAKSVPSGYVPLGGVVVFDAVSATFADHMYPGGSTVLRSPIHAVAQPHILHAHGCH